MIVVHRGADSRGALQKSTLAVDEPLPKDSLWIDLVTPTPEEDRLVEQYLGLEVPTHADMNEIEPSELLYTSHGAHYMTARLLCGANEERRHAVPVTFILTKSALVTVRYDEPQAFAMFAHRIARPGERAVTPGAVLAALIETVSDQAVDVLQGLGAAVDDLSATIFGPDIGRQAKRQQHILKELGKVGETVGRARISLVTVERMLLFITGGERAGQIDPDLVAQARTTLRDQQALEMHADFISGKIQFLLDAMLGVVNLDQNNIIKLFSVISVIFMPPTVIASMYGMNFKHMPELDWTYGYPMALCAMLASAVLPYVFFKWRGWL
jgi:magnesium transporter